MLHLTGQYARSVTLVKGKNGLLLDYQLESRRLLILVRLLEKP